MKTYTFEVVIHEGNDEFWEEINEQNVTGCEAVKNIIDVALSQHGLFDGDNCEIKLKKFEDE